MVAWCYGAAYSLCWNSSTTGWRTEPTRSPAKFRSTPTSISGKGPIGVMARGLMSLWLLVY